MSISIKSTDDPPPYTRESDYQTERVNGYVEGRHADVVRRDGNSAVGFDSRTERIEYLDRNETGCSGSASEPGSSTRRIPRGASFQPISPSINCQQSSYPKRAQHHQPSGYMQQHQPAIGRGVLDVV